MANAQRRPDDGRTWLLHGGPVHPLGGDDRTYDAILLRDGKVLGAGDRADLSRAAGSRVTEVDLDGRTVVPGLIDIHPHLMQHAAQLAPLVDITDALDHDDIVARIAERARTTPPGEWIITTPVGEPFYFLRRSYRDLAEGVLPDRRVLDRATSEHPVLIQAWAPVTPNICVFNTAGLRRVGITDFIPDRVCDVWIDKYPRSSGGDGSATGILRGSVNQIYNFDPFWTQILRQLPLMPADPATVTPAAMAAYNARGVTTVYEPHNMTPLYLDAYRKLHADGALTTRVAISLEVENCARPPFQPLTMGEFGDSMARGREALGEGDELLRVCGLTLAASGGPCWPGHMQMPEPYEDPYGRPTKGTPFISPEKIEAFARYCLDHDIRANFLAAGLTDHDTILGVLDTPGIASRMPRGPGRSWIVQHAPVITEPQARHYQRLGFDLTTCPGFAWAKGEMYGERIGRHIWRDTGPLKRLVRAGLTVACGTDWGPKNPFEQMKLAQTHTFAVSGRSNATEDHAVTRREALDMWTTNGGRVLDWGGVGTLAPGAAADLIVLDRSPLTCDIDELPATRVELTMLAGRVVHDPGALAG
ncbi:amidohydrolase [Streptomyces sp. NPDC055078]